MYCQVCGRSLADQQNDQCPVCHPLFLQDHAQNKFPAPFLGIRDLMTYDMWIGLRVVERDGARAGKSKEVIYQDVLAYARDRRERYDAAQKRAQEMANIAAEQAKVRARYSY